MQGQATHFRVFAPEKVEYGIQRYTNEVRRLYGVIEQALSDGRKWLAAGEYTVADIANFSWIYVHNMAGEQSCHQQHLTLSATLSLLCNSSYYRHDKAPLCSSAPAGLCVERVYCSVMCLS